MYYKKERARKIERKFTNDTPVDVVLQQLVKEKFPDARSVDEIKMRRFFEKAHKAIQKDPLLLENIIHFLNRGLHPAGKEREEDTLVSIDQVLKNIEIVSQKKNIQLKSVSPQHMRGIQRFENLNDFTKEIKVVEKKPDPLSAT